MRYFWLAFGLCFVASCVVWKLAPASFTVTNGTDQPIRYLTVGVAEMKFHFENIPPGGKVSGRFYFSGEATFDLEGLFTDGSKVSDCCGYLVWEDIAPHCRMVVKPDGMVCEERYHVTPTQLP